MLRKLVELLRDLRDITSSTRNRTRQGKKKNSPISVEILEDRQAPAFLSSPVSVQDLALSMTPIEARIMQALGESAPTFSSAATTTFTVGTSGTFNISTIGFPAAKVTETGALPSGVVFSSGSNGTATLRGTPATGTTGTYHITLTATNGIAPAATQSFTLKVTAPVDLTQTTVQVSPASVQSGSTTTVTLTAKDASGIQLPVGGATVVFSLGSGTGQGVFSAVADHGNGIYTATFTGTTVGTNTITATFNSQAVTSTAPTVTVTAGPVSLSQSTVAVVPASVESGVANAATVTLTAKDANGNQEPTGGLTVAFTLVSGAGSGTFSVVTDNGDGTYTATFTGTTIGPNSIRATINGQAVTSTAPAITVTPSLSNSTVTVSPSSVQSGVAGAATVTLTARDADGNQATTGGLTVVFGLGGGTATGTFSAVTDHGDGTYTATFTGATLGTNTITATINGQVVTSEAPTITVTPGAIDPAQSTVAVTPSSVVSGVADAATVTLTARDSAGNQETSGGATVVFGLGAGTATGTFSAVTDNGDGTYTATFTGVLAGTNTITATVDGNSLTSTAPTIAVTPGPVDLTQSNVTLASSSVPSGDTTTVTLTARDAAGNQETAGGLTVLFSLGAGAATGSFSAVTDNGDGTYTATFTANGLGSNTIAATIGGNPVTSTAPTITVTPSVSQSTISVSPATIMSGVADAATVTLTARDAAGNQATTGGDTVVFSLGAGAATGTFSAVTDNGDGTYTATFTGILGGTNTITATIDGHALTSVAPTITVTPGAVDLAQTTVAVSPSSVESGVANAATITLTARDAAGNQETTGGGTVVFSLGAGAGGGTFGAVTDNGDGTYTAKFTGSTLGTNTITATFDGNPVTSVAPVITVTPSLSQSTVSVSPASIVSGVANAATITLVARDASGNQATTGGLTVVFSLGAGTATGTLNAVTDNGDGTYTATFTGIIAGTNTIIATIDGSALTSPAPTVTVTPGAVDLVHTSVAITPTAVESGLANAATVTLTARDAAGNQETTGGLTIVFGLGAGVGSGTFSAVTDHGDGTYTATFTGSTLGSNIITATVDGNPVTSTAANFTVTPSLSQSTVSVTPASVVAGVPDAATVTLTTRDGAGNPATTGGATVVFTLGAGTATGTFSAVTDNGDGTYTATFTGDLAGTNTISATLDGQALTSAAPTITVTVGSVSLAQSTVSVSPASVIAGVADAATVTLTAKDAGGNQLTTGGLTVAFGLGAGAATGTLSAVTDHGDGTYTATFTGILAGTNTITATIGGNPVTSTAPAITVTPGAVDLAQSVVSVGSAEVASGLTTIVTLTAKDANGNQETSGGLTVLFSLGAGAGGGTFSSVTDNGDGTYTATFTGTSLGTNTISATIGGNPVTSPAANITVTPSPSQTTVSVTPASVVSGVANAATITLVARDANGNQATSGGATVVFHLGAGAATGTISAVTDNGDGTYTATFTGILAGTNTITASIDGQAVTSPAPVITVTPGAVSLAQSGVSVAAGTVHSGQTTTVTLTAKDAAGNLLTTGGDTVLFQLGSGAGGGTFSAVTDNGDGTYTATFTADVIGANTITATINANPITSTPANITVTPSLQMSSVTISPNSLAVGDTATVTFVARDAAGNSATTGGDFIVFGLGAGAGSGTFSAVTDNGDGTYTATFTATTPGANNITATLDGDPITSMPPIFTIT